MFSLVTYMTARCDGCGRVAECASGHDDDVTVAALFVDEVDAARWLGRGSGWRVQAGGVLACRQCAAEHDCAVYGCVWGTWVVCDCAGGRGDHADGQIGGACTYRYRLCLRCNEVEEAGTDTCSPVPAHPAALAGAESWEQLVSAAVHEVFPMGVADVIVRADAFGALVYRVRQRCQLVEATPCDVLREIDEGDQWFAGHADEPAAFLAAKVREL